MVNYKISCRRAHLKKRKEELRILLPSSATNTFSKHVASCVENTSFDTTAILLQKAKTHRVQEVSVRKQQYSGFEKARGIFRERSVPAGRRLE